MPRNVKECSPRFWTCFGKSARTSEGINRSWFQARGWAGLHGKSRNLVRSTDILLSISLIVSSGYNTTANELSFFMNLAFRFLLSSDTTASINQHTLHPYAHWFSHQRSTNANFRTVSFPDVIPRLTSTFHLVETDFLNLSAPSHTHLDTVSDLSTWSRSEATYQSGYDYIVTLFFIDTSQNVFATLEKIYTLLCPGGTWINLGPLLWTSGGQSKLELSLEEVLEAAEEIGFIFDEAEDPSTSAGDVRARRIDCEYTADSSAMMQWIYRAEFWVARKPK